MNQTSFKKNLFKWAFIELFLLGGYWGAESFLPPLFEKGLPEPWKNLGWCTLHAVLQLWVFYKVLRPLINQRLNELYADLSPRMKGITLFFALVPLGAFLFLGFLYFAKPRAQGVPAPFLLRRGFAALVVFLNPIIGALDFFSQETYLDLVPLKEGIHQFAYWATSPNSLYLSDLGRSVKQVTLVKTKISNSPELFGETRTRIREYQSIEATSSLIVLLFLADEAIFQAQTIKLAKKRQEPNSDLNTVLRFTEVSVASLELSRMKKPFAFQMNPFSLMNAGALELLLLRYIDEDVSYKTNQLYKKDLPKLFLSLKRRADPVPEVKDQIQVLQGKIETLFPGALQDLSLMQEKAASQSKETAISR